jgi:hypothetical protein
MGLTQPREETRMSQQNTGGESNPAHFSVNGVSRRPSPEQFREGFPALASTKCRVKQLFVLFRHRRVKD